MIAGEVFVLLYLLICRYWTEILALERMTGYHSDTFSKLFFQSLEKVLTFLFLSDIIIAFEWFVSHPAFESLRATGSSKGYYTKIDRHFNEVEA